MKYFHLFAGEDGISRFEDREVEFTLQDFAPPAPALYLSGSEAATQLVYVTLPAGWTGEQHRSPKKQVLFCLSGTILVEAGDGSSREIRTGDVWRMEDTTGPGHTTSVIGDEEVRLGIVQVE